jgi:hypothetical protein
MQGRTQVILVATGLGGHPLEDVIPPPQSKPEPVAEIEPESLPVETMPVPMISNASNNLDVPAFLRRRLQ